MQVSCREMESDGECARILFICRDTGIGMSKEFQKHAFEILHRNIRLREPLIMEAGLGFLS